MNAPTENDLKELVDVEAPPATFMGDAPHVFVPLAENPAWCTCCPLPREHRVHTAPAREQP